MKKSTKITRKMRREISDKILEGRSIQEIRRELNLSKKQIADFLRKLVGS